MRFQSSFLKWKFQMPKGYLPKGFDANYYKYYGHFPHIKAHFAGDKRKSQGCNINSSSLSLSISHYLQIHRTEISFSDHQQGVNDVYTLKSIKMSSFFDFHKHYSEDITLRWRDEDEDGVLKRLHFLSITHGLITYVFMIVWY